MEHEIINAIRNLEDLRWIKPAADEQIAAAEAALGIPFAPDYRAYVRRYGAISARGIELTGVTSARRLDVVEVTGRERALNPLLPKNMYVIENLGIDGIVMLQDSTGAIYSLHPNRGPKRELENLTEYVRQSVF